MKKIYLALISLLAFGFVNAQTPTGQLHTSGGSQPIFNVPGQLQYKAPGDSCGAYFNNYIGLKKTSAVYVEYMREDTTNNAFFNGYTVRFHANQPIEISGVEFYAYDTSSAVDSIMVIAKLNDYDEVNDTLGTEFARDTVYVKHDHFDIVLPNMAVQAYFDTPIIVTHDYMLSITNPSEDSLGMIISTNGDGQGESLTYQYFQNVNYPSYDGIINQYTQYGWDFDGLVSPRVNFQIQNGFAITDDQICPNVVSAGCVDYTQMPVFTDPHYNYYSTTPEHYIKWQWGDGLQNTQLLNACHTYTSVGTYDIILQDTLRRFLYGNYKCGFERSLPIYVLDSATADFTWVNNDTWVSFTNNSTLADSVLWDFGDSTYSTVWDAFHAYDSVGTYDVMLVAYGKCGNDTTTISVTVDNLGIEDYNFNFKMYPNPANNNVTVTGLVEGIRIEVLNIVGETILKDYATSNNLVLPTDNLSNGTYFVRVSTDYGQVSKKLMIRH